MNEAASPSPLAFPVDMYEPTFVAGSSDTTREFLVEKFGEPTGLFDPSDPGPMERWAFQYPCGLKLVYLLDLIGHYTLVTADVPEVAHVARHLPFDSARVQLAPKSEMQKQIDTDLSFYPERQSEFDGLHVAQVWRQGDDGNEFPVGELTSERDAKCHVAELESHGHKQLYWYSLR